MPLLFSLLSSSFLFPGTLNDLSFGSYLEQSGDLKVDISNWINQKMDQDCILLSKESAYQTYTADFLVLLIREQLNSVLFRSSLILTNTLNYYT